METWVVTATTRSFGFGGGMVVGTDGPEVIFSGTEGECVAERGRLCAIQQELRKVPRDKLVMFQEGTLNTSYVVKKGKVSVA